MKINFLKLQYPKDMDKECIDICDVLNSLPGVITQESCCGHLESNFMIFIECRSFESLAIIARSIDRRYCCTIVPWKMTVETSDIFPCFNFQLYSEGKYNSYEDMSKDVNNIIDNIKYWTRDEYDNYFRYNYYRWRELNGTDEPLEIKEKQSN